MHRDDRGSIVVEEGREEEVRGVISQDDAILQLEVFGKVYNITLRRKGGREGGREGGGEGRVTFLSL